MTVLTFGSKAKDFGNSWSSFWRELRARSAFDRCVLFTRVHGLCCQRLGLTWVGTSYMIPTVYRDIDSYSVLHLIVYRGTCLTCVSSVAWLSWLPSLTWRTWGTWCSCVTIGIIYEVPTQGNHISSTYPYLVINRCLWSPWTLGTKLLDLLSRMSLCRREKTALGTHHLIG